MNPSIIAIFRPVFQIVSCFLSGIVNQGYRLRRIPNPWLRYPIYLFRFGDIGATTIVPDVILFGTRSASVFALRHRAPREQVPRLNRQALCDCEPMPTFHQY